MERVSEKERGREKNECVLCAVWVCVTSEFNSHESIYTHFSPSPSASSFRSVPNPILSPRSASSSSRRRRLRLPVRVLPPHTPIQLLSEDRIQEHVKHSAKRHITFPAASQRRVKERQRQRQRGEILGEEHTTSSPWRGVS